jgi:hypothetical protein
MPLQALTQTAATPPQFSSLELMTLVFRITALFDKAAHKASEQKRSHLSIFEIHSKGQASLKTFEGWTMVALAGVSAGVGCSMMTTPQAIAQTINAALSVFNQGVPAFFSTHHLTHECKKQMAQTEVEAAKGTSDSTKRAREQAFDTLTTLVRQLDSLTHTK